VRAICNLTGTAFLGAMRIARKAGSTALLSGLAGLCAGGFDDLATADTGARVARRLRLEIVLIGMYHHRFADHRLRSAQLHLVVFRALLQQPGATTVPSDFVRYRSGRPPDFAS